MTTFMEDTAPVFGMVLAAAFGLAGLGHLVDTYGQREMKAAQVQLEQGTTHRYAPKMQVPQELTGSPRYGTNLTFEGTTTHEGNKYALIREQCRNSNLREIQEGMTSTIVLGCGYGIPLQVTAKDVEQGQATLETRVLK